METPNTGKICVLCMYLKLRCWTKHETVHDLSFRSVREKTEVKLDMEREQDSLENNISLIRKYGHVVFVPGHRPTTFLVTYDICESASNKLYETFCVKPRQFIANCHSKVSSVINVGK